ncbi:PRC-barrel domain-containing protein [Brevundimonas nasdae]|uniref:PRC-barrel domain-containing protein n=1 Tax=Brevundimonas nasdae TaxID=172043 RepID=A0ABX8TD81_9CAUL|nr:PRC-barrel domain-containing protein [Brevundimonas nasdae]QYC08907.1 PRC-barrel domain-containing protein [Brevundimonas nasdae]QYC14957.1 PRC-barrel domain-containing protein [Brevundimonas nasdae]
MTRSLMIAAAAAALLAACSQQKETPSAAAPADTAPAVGPAMTAQPDAAAMTQGEPLVLGLRSAQLEGANLLSTDGTDVGDVQKVDVGSDGKATGLIVAPTGVGERWVRLPLAGLTVKTLGDDHVVVTGLTLDQVKALPAWAP